MGVAVNIYISGLTAILLKLGRSVMRLLNRK